MFYPRWGGGVDNLLRVWVLPIWVDFWAQNCPSKGSFSAHFSLNISGFGRNSPKMIKHGQISAKSFHKYEGKFW